MKAIYLAAITLACLAATGSAETQFPILNTEGCECAPGCPCGPDCPCPAGDCGDAGCATAAPNGEAAEAPAFMQRGPVRRVLAEAKPARRVLGAAANVVRNRPRILRRLACRAFGGCR